jgi:hypothetical protein
MTDREIARILRQGRRQGYEQACGIALIAAAVVSAFVHDPADTLIVAASVVLGALAVGAVTSNRDLDE